MKVLKLKEFRKKLKLRQEDVANNLKITQAYYSLWEVGKRMPDAQQILQLCNVFQCTPNDLFGIQGDYIVAMDPIVKATESQE